MISTLFCRFFILGILACFEDWDLYKLSLGLPAFSPSDRLFDSKTQVYLIRCSSTEAKSIDQTDNPSDRVRNGLNIYQHFSLPLFMYLPIFDSLCSSALLKLLIIKAKTNKIAI